MNDQNIGRELANWAAKTPQIRESDIVDVARSALVDIIGCMVAGSHRKEVHLIATAADEWARGGRSFVIGRRDKFHAPWAALVNGTAAHALDFDDNFLPAFTHATSVLIPALLAISDAEDLSGPQLIDAYIVGLELHARIGKLVNPEHFKKGWHATSTVGTIGTAGACARLLKLPAEAVLASMSIGFSLASGSKKQFGSMMKPAHAGIAAQHAVIAARMASRGLTANVEFLTGTASFQDLYAGPDAMKADNSLKDLGKAYCVKEQGLIVKRFPCCASAHKTLDGLLSLKESHTLRSSDIKSIIARLPETLCRNLPFLIPQNEMEARFSLPYTAARIIEDGFLSLKHFAPAAICDFGNNDLLRRIHVETIPDPNEISLKTPVTTSVELVNGQMLEIEIVDLKGSKSKPLLEQELEMKFFDCFAFAGIKEKANELLEIAMTIERLRHTSTLTDSLSELW